MREADLSRKIVNAIRKQWNGCYVRKNHGNAFTTVGRPDLEVVAEGVPIFLEVKVPGEKPTPAQIAEGEEIERAGAMWSIVTSPEEAIDVVESALDIAEDD